VLLRGSQLLENSFLSHGIENSQLLLQYGHAYQLSVQANVKTMESTARMRNDVKTETHHTMQQNVNF
jgi:hypothetical protein